MTHTDLVKTFVRASEGKVIQEKIVVKDFLLKSKPLTSLYSHQREILSVLKTNNEKNEIINLEEEVFKALDHQMRRDILRYIGEEKTVGFTEIMNNVKVSDSPTLSYHLKPLGPFVEQRDGKYGLTVIGRDAYNLLLKTSSYNRLALFWRNRRNATMGTSILWLIAIVAALYMELDMIFTVVILPTLAAIAMSTVYQLFE